MTSFVFSDKIIPHSITEKTNHTMIISKVTTGFVIQQYDTNTDAWVSQQFVADPHYYYEDKFGKAVNSEIMGDPEPYLPFDMVQPPVVK